MYFVFETEDDVGLQSSKININLKVTVFQSSS